MLCILRMYIKKVIETHVYQYDDIILYFVVEGGSSREAVSRIFQKRGDKFSQIDRLGVSFQIE